MDLDPRRQLSGPAALRQDTTFALPDALSTALAHGWRIFARDFAKVFGAPPATVAPAVADIRLVLDTTLAPETFALDVAGTTATLAGADDLGLVYGLLHLSEHVLGVEPFWFWTDRAPAPRPGAALTLAPYRSTPARLRYRGWFVNDEVCLIGWSDSYPPPAATWEIVFETLLRLGGNLVIPGTDLPRAGVHWDVAAAMGLYVTHHHAEPLGAEMFFRVHPDSDASYGRNPDLFEALWREAIARQAGRKVVWTLGFRGQGDCPFWEQDPSYDTPESRGALISRAIARQHALLTEALGDVPCLTYLYGEMTELYRDGHLRFPDGVIRIWSDNGYGRMVSRRQGNDNPRVDALPAPGDAGRHGLYYHATFHDLQASSHLTLLPVDPRLIAGELARAFTAGADDLLLVNCGNVRPHVPTLDLIARLWRDGEVDALGFPEAFAARHFGAAAAEAAVCLRGYVAAAIAYGPNADDRAGDEFYHHPARSLIGHLMRGETDGPVPDLVWATGAIDFDAQAAWFRARAAGAEPAFAALVADAEAVGDALPADQATFWRDLLMFQARLHLSGCRGLAHLCDAIALFRRGEHAKAFVRASQALHAYGATLDAMAAAEHGKWRRFFSADWLTNVRITLYAVDGLRRYIRVFGDNPDYFLWHKAYLMPESEKKLYLENTHRAPPDDDDLAERLAVAFGL